MPVYMNRFPRIVTVTQADKNYQASSAHSTKEVRRVERLFTKEPGTIEWLKQTLRPDDVFFDIGANIGVYSIFAARRDRRCRLGLCLRAPRRQRGIAPAEHRANDLARQSSCDLRCRSPIGTALRPFHYHSLESSRSHSQFGPPILDGEPFDPVATEIKYGYRLDSLIESGIIPMPTVVKSMSTGSKPKSLPG